MHCSYVADSHIKHFLDTGVMYGLICGLQVPPVQFSTRINLWASTEYFQDVVTVCTCESVYLYFLLIVKRGHKCEPRFVILHFSSVVNV
jgi:hypothetical protein